MQWKGLFVLMASEPPGYDRQTSVRAEPALASVDQGAAERIKAKQGPVIPSRIPSTASFRVQNLESLGSMFGTVSLQGFQWKFSSKHQSCCQNPATTTLVLSQLKAPMAFPC